MSTPKGICEKCGAHRGLDVPPFHALQYAMNQPLGWYWGPDEGVELCGACLLTMLDETNGERNG